MYIYLCACVCREKERGDHEFVKLGIGSKARGRRNGVALARVIFSPDFLQQARDFRRRPNLQQQHP